MSQITVVESLWSEHREILRKIRKQVFIKEQNVPEALEWDDYDEHCQHFIAFIDGEAIGCARLIEQHKIGRMAVLKPFRTLGVGTLLIDHIKALAARNDQPQLELSSQCHAYAFYQKNGFEALSQPYDDARMPHIDMAHSVSLTTQNNGLFRFGHDEDIYHGSSLLETQGLLDAMISQTQRSMILCLKDLAHPLCRHNALIEKIKALARHNRHFKVYVLINHYQVQDNDHALFRLQDRLPSFIEIKKTNDNIPCLLLMDNTAWFDFELNTSRACFSNRPRVRYFMERFKKWWHTAQPIIDARRLSI